MSECMFVVYVDSWVGWLVVVYLNGCWVVWLVEGRKHRETKKRVYRRRKRRRKKVAKETETEKRNRKKKTSHHRN